jgi:phosphoribosylglycinamide formyltransferase-1
MRRTPVAVFLSGRGSNYAALAAATAAADYPAEIVAVLADSDAEGLRRVPGIPGTAVERREYPSRAAFEDALDAATRAAGAELICLAGFMRILSPAFVARWEGRILNIHPSMLPSFRGLDTHARALAAGVKLHGATVHLVTPELDDGPILAQAAVPVLPDDTAETLAARVLAVEHRLYPAALARFVRGGGPVSGEDAALFSPPVP